MTAILGFLFLGCLAIARGRSTGEIAPSSRTGAEPAPPALVPLAPPPSPSKIGLERELIGLIDARRHAVAGNWQLVDATLITPAIPFARLMLPVEAPDSYDLIVVAQRESGNNSLDIGLSTKGRQVVVVLDGGDAGDQGGLDLVEGRSFLENPSAFRNRFFAPGRSVTVVCSVRSTGIRVEVDGKGVIDWKGPPDLLAPYKDWMMPDNSTPFIGSWSSVFRIRRLAIRPVVEAPPADQ